MPVLTSLAAYTGPVPKAVLEAFHAKYPTATKVEWEAEEENEYEAEFKIGKKELSTVFSSDGTWMETETVLNKSALPSTVKSSINKHFTSFKIEEVELVERPNTANLYEVELMEKGGDEKWEATFDQNGKLLSKEQEEEEDDE